MPDHGRWAVVVHGGAKTIAPELSARNRDGCAAAAAAAAAVLSHGGSAVAATEAALRRLEDDPVFNAGFGSVLNRDGEVEMDAAIMDGTTLAAGAVTGVRRVPNPARIARALLHEHAVLLAGEGAERFAIECGIPLCNAREMISNEALASENVRTHDTVGCVALDMQGALAAGTSTGGLPGKLAGRVGDSPLPGCGLLADDRAGAVAFSGDGESIIRTTLAAHVMHALELGRGAAAAAETALERLARVGGEAGVILIDPEGRIGIAHNSTHFALAVHTDSLEKPVAALARHELQELLDG